MQLQQPKGKTSALTFYRKVIHGPEFRRNPKQSLNYAFLDH